MEGICKDASVRFDGNGDFSFVAFYLYGERGYFKRDEARGDESRIGHADTGGTGIAAAR